MLLLLVLSFISLLPSSRAQLVSLFSGTENTLSLDLDRLYNYNLYEKSRWGLGLQYDIALGGSRPQTLSLSAYGAYGYADKRFKWGVKADYLVASSRQHHTYLGFFHDLTPAASRIVTTPTLAILNSPASFMTRLFNDTYRLYWGHTCKVSRKLTGGFELDLSRERELYSNGIPRNKAQLYPGSSELGDLKKLDFAELKILLSHTYGWDGIVTLGLCNDRSTGPDFFLRVLTQYDRDFFFSPFQFKLYAQGGYVYGHASYSRMFDLGGSWGCSLSLNHTLLTARQNEFTAKLFALVNMKLSTEKPLFTLSNSLLAVGTAPQPFLLCNAAWGTSFSDNDIYPAPTKGIAEVGAGIDGILVWGLVKWGGAVVYRLTPSSADYHFTEPKDNLVILLTAILNL